MARPRLILLATVATALMIAAVGAWILLDRQPTANPDSKQQIVLGQNVYSANCASCHGNNLEGELNWKIRKENGRLPAPPHDTSGHTWHHADEQLFGIVKDGLAAYAPAGYVTDMPAFKGILSDAEIHAVLAYIKSLWPLDIRERQREISAQTTKN